MKHASVIIRVGWAMMLWSMASARLSADQTPAEAGYRIFRGKSPEVIARYLAHPYPQAVHGIARALAEHGERALPLLKELIKDRHPGVRRGAVLTLGIMYARDQSKESGDEQRPVSPEAKEALALLARMIDEPDPWVQIDLGSVVEKIGAETEEMHQLVIRMGRSPDAAARAKALWLARHRITTPEVKVQVGIQVDSTPEGNTPRHWEQAHYVMQQGKERAKPALPILACFFHDQAYKLRGMFSDSAILRALDVIRAYQQDPAALVTVPGLCRTYVRLCDSEYHGWVACQEQTLKMLETLAPRARTVFRNAIDSEKKFLASATDEELASYGTNRKCAHARLTKLVQMMNKRGTGP